MIDASLNEVEGVAAKAARGAQLSWGICEDAGKAARWLAAHDLPWAPSLIALLESIKQTGSPEVSIAGLKPLDEFKDLSPLQSGPFIADLGIQGTKLRVERILWPVWLLPYLARATRFSRQTLTVQWNGASVFLTPDVCFADMPPDLAAGGPVTVVISPGPAPDALPEALPTVSRSRISAAHWRTLDEIGARTYVPSSMQSRAKGAGAGLVDND